MDATRLSLAARGQKPHEHGPMRRPQSCGDSRGMHCTPMLGSRGAGSNAPLVVTWTS